MLLFFFSACSVLQHFPPHQLLLVVYVRTGTLHTMGTIPPYTAHANTSSTHHVFVSCAAVPLFQNHTVYARGNQDLAREQACVECEV